ncbi:hypothetical protein [Colwellia sp. Bg11-28]|uniref:hypothetical protein n=1 Tax=Colwellia sp. Bg11-28 TaxID=2058305 RepID=UPI000C338FD4|nr:hypothetical protein [Colwellia sp. Bg11-28]PKH88321.1 hypothetical protein CXF79_06035 [Colwellia sp. Bg11-28]
MKNKQKVDIQICSDVDYECLIAEITIDGTFFGLVTNEPSKGICFEAPEGQVSDEPIDLETYIRALKEAKSELLK